MRFHTRDWLDNKELRRCSPPARAVLADLMCLAHEGAPYGYLCDKVGPLTVGYMASRCFMKSVPFLKALAELAAHGRIAQSEDGRYYIPRLVEDEEIRQKRSEEGSRGGNPRLMKASLKGVVNHPDKDGLKHAGAGADSDSVSVSDSQEEVIPFIPKNQLPTNAPGSPVSQRFLEFWERYPVKDGQAVTHGAWETLVTPLNEDSVFACLERYLSSDRGDRSPKNPRNWLHDCARDNWNSDWPRARAPDGVRLQREQKIIANLEALDELRRNQ